MALEPAAQEELYDRYWYPMEQRFGHSEYSSLFDRFMRDYLTINSELGTIPNIDQVYNEFKKYVRGRDVSSVIADVALYSRYFVRLAFPVRNDDLEIRRILSNINMLKVDVAYPLLLEVFDDYERFHRLDRNEFIEILRLVETYVFRRAIVGIPTNSMNKTFATFKRSLNKDDYLNSVKFIFITLDSYRRFPKDEEFWNEFVQKDIYNLRQRRNYLLSKLENHDRKEEVNIEEYTIEHIMPQNEKLSHHWQRELGDKWREVQQRYIHTVGNLTLTGYNPELSDRPFIEKRDMKGGFADSPIRLNRSISKLDRWGEKEINDRGIELASLALQVWDFPRLDDAIMSRYGAKVEIESDDYSLADFEHLQGEVLSLFDSLRTRILNLDSSVREEPKSKYIAYKTTTNFVDIQPQQSRLRIWLNLRFDELNDPQHICRDVSQVGHYGNGDVQFNIDSHNEIEYGLFLIRQSFEKYTDGFEI